MQTLGWGAAIEDKLNPLGQALATINEPCDCSLLFSQLQASAQEAVKQPSDSHLMQEYFVHKIDVGLEQYLLQTDSFQLRCSLTESGQHCLHCHRRRFHGLPYEARVCHACVQHVVIMPCLFAQSRELPNVILLTCICSSPGPRKR